MMGPLVAIALIGGIALACLVAVLIADWCDREEYR